MTIANVYEVRDILDKFTVLIGATRGSVNLLSPGTELWVLGVGPYSSRLQSLIIVEKAHLFVHSNAGSYVVAQPKVREVREELNFGTAFLATFGGTTTRAVRDPLSVDEKALTGNPGNRPIAIGDPVICPEDFAEFVKEMSAAAATANKEK